MADGKIVRNADPDAKDPTRKEWPRKRPVGLLRLSPSDMEKLIQQGRLLFVVSVIGFGVANMLSAHSVFTGLGASPRLPVIPWVPAHRWMGYLTGVLFLAGGVCLWRGATARVSAMALGFFFLFFALVMQLPLMLAAPSSIGVRTIVLETLSMSAGAFALVTYPPEGKQWRFGEVSGRLSGLLFGACLLVFGIDHLLIIRFIASLVPAWMPWHVFWAYFTGFSLIAAAISIATGWMGRLGAFLIGLMFLLWVLLLHLPRTLGMSRAGAGPHSPDEWSSLLIALAMGGASWIFAADLWKTEGNGDSGLSKLRGR